MSARIAGVNRHSTPIAPKDAAALARAVAKVDDARERLTAAIDARDEIVARLALEGAAYRPLGELCGLSHTQVKNIADAAARP